MNNNKSSPSIVAVLVVLSLNLVTPGTVQSQEPAVFDSILGKWNLVWTNPGRGTIRQQVVFVNRYGKLVISGFKYTVTDWGPDADSEKEVNVDFQNLQYDGVHLKGELYSVDFLNDMGGRSLPFTVAVAKGSNSLLGNSLWSGEVQGTVHFSRVSECLAVEFIPVHSFSQEGEPQSLVDCPNPIGTYQIRVYTTVDEYAAVNKPMLTAGAGFGSSTTSWLDREFSDIYKRAFLDGRENIFRTSLVRRVAEGTSAGLQTNSRVVFESSATTLALTKIDEGNIRNTEDFEGWISDRKGIRILTQPPPPFGITSTIKENTTIRIDLMTDRAHSSKYDLYGDGLAQIGLTTNLGARALGSSETLDPWIAYQRYGEYSGKKDLVKFDDFLAKPTIHLNSRSRGSVSGAGGAFQYDLNSVLGSDRQSIQADPGGAKVSFVFSPTVSLGASIGIGPVSVSLGGMQMVYESDDSASREKFKRIRLGPNPISGTQTLYQGDSLQVTVRNEVESIIAAVLDRPKLYGRALGSATANVSHYLRVIGRPGIEGMTDMPIQVYFGQPLRSDSTTTSQKPTAGELPDGFDIGGHTGLGEGDFHDASIVVGEKVFFLRRPSGSAAPTETTSSTESWILEGR